MTMQTQETLQNQTATSSSGTAEVPFWGDDVQSEEQQYRAGAYSMLAALLRSSPEQAILDPVAELSNLTRTEDELALALSMLGLAARNSALESLEDEYHALFIGLGRGELVPFGSWYLTGFLMEKPLAMLRSDLSLLGFERSADTHEPEDHVAALCEVMAMLISEGQELETQSRFFEAHIAPWFSQFFSDLSTAKTAVFYRSVGRFGAAFTEFEHQYLSMKV